MTYKKHSQRAAQAKKNKALFVFRVIWVVDQFGALVDKDRLSFLEAHAMLSRIGGSFPVVPLEAKGAHASSLTTL